MSVSVITRKRSLVWPCWLAMVLIIAGCAEEFTADEHIARAESYIKEAEYKTAEIELKNALKQQPKNAKARFILGKLYSDLGNGAAAEKELEVALNLGVAREAIILPYAQAIAQQLKNRKILDEVVILDQLDPSQKARIHVYRGNAYLNTGENKNARLAFEDALKMVDGFALANLGLAKLAIAQGEYDESMKLVDLAIKSNPELPVLWEHKADLYESRGQHGQAISNYDKAVEIPGFNPHIYAKRAVLKVRSGQLDSAAEDIKKAHQITPDYFLALFAEGLLEVRRKNYESAMSAFELALKANDSYRPTYFFMALINIFDKQLLIAEKNLKQFLYGYPGSLSGVVTLSMVQFRLGEYEVAKNSLEPALRAFPENEQANQLAASIAFALGDQEAGIAFLQRLAKQKPEDPSVLKQMGVAQLMYGDRALGVESLVEALAANPEIEGLEVVIANAWIKEKEYKKAQLWIDKIRKRYPRQYLGDATQGLLYAAQKNKPAAVDSFRKALVIKPGTYAVSDQLASLYLAEQKYDQAEQVYRDLLKVHKDHPFAYMDLARIKAIRGDEQAMETLLKQVIALSPTEVLPRVVLAKFYLKKGDNVQALAQLDANFLDNQKSLDYFATLIEAQRSNGQQQRVKTTAILAAEKYPRSALAHYMVAQADQTLGDNDAARVSIEKSLQIFPAYIPSRLLLARVMIEAGEYADAGEIIGQLQKELPDDKNVVLLHAQHQTAVGNHEVASRLYQDIYESKPATRSVSDLSWSNYFAGNTKVAESLLKEWLQQHPDDIQVRFSLIQIYRGMGQTDDATSQLETLLELHGGNAIVLNELAWQLYVEEQFEQAYAFAEKAYKKSPKSPAIRDTYGLTLLEMGQSEKGLQVLGAVAADYPGNASFIFHYAQALLSVGRTSLAVTQLEKALALSTNLTEKREIITLLDSIQG